MYAAALTSDGRRCAYGCVDAAVRVVDVDLREETHRMAGDGAINALAWTSCRGATFLAVGGEDKHVVVWAVHERGDRAGEADERAAHGAERFLVLPRPFPVTAVAFSDVSLACRPRRNKRSRGDARRRGRRGRDRRRERSSPPPEIVEAERRE